MNITDFHRHGNLYWHGCYTSFRRWDNYVTNESYAHPAKMSPKLCEKIFKHLKKHGLLKESDIICDFMAGIGTTNIVASLHRMKTVSIELEPHFIEMEKENKEKIEEFLGVPLDWEIIQGDSRDLSRIIKERCVGVIFPPYTSISIAKNAPSIDKRKQYETYRKQGGGMSFKAFLSQQERHSVEYSSDPKNIGNLPDKTMVGIISPPYSESQEVCEEAIS